MLSAIQIHAKY
jgi:hypothetical protein